MTDFKPKVWMTRPLCGKQSPMPDPDAREWVGLTDDEVSTLIGNEIGFNSCSGWETEYTRAVEAKLKEKNEM
jgi:hypothetical protein